MPLYGQSRDISLFRHINRELIGDIISTQCSFYKFRLDKTKINVYGESSGEKYYNGPILVNCLIKREDQKYVETDLGTDFTWGITFKFLRDDLLGKMEEFNSNTEYGADLEPQVGDIIMYQEAYYEVHNINVNQYFIGKNPDYPNQPNPFDSTLDEFGYNVSIICNTHYIPSDKVGLKLRLT